MHIPLEYDRKCACKCHRRSIHSRVGLNIFQCDCYSTSDWMSNIQRSIYIYSINRLWEAIVFENYFRIWYLREVVERHLAAFYSTFYLSTDPNAMRGKLNQMTMISSIEYISLERGKVSRRRQSVIFEWIIFGFIAGRNVVNSNWRTFFHLYLHWIFALNSDVRNVFFGI